MSWLNKYTKDCKRKNGKNPRLFLCHGQILFVLAQTVPLTDADALAAFCLQRASYVAQTTLYGYLRTRAGLQHFNLFTDKKFVAVLKPARTRLVLVCLDDLTVYAAAILPELSAQRRAELAAALLRAWHCRFAR